MKRSLAIIVLLISFLFLQAQKLPDVSVKREIKKLAVAGEWEIRTTIKASFLYDLSSYEDVLPKNDSMKITLMDAGEAKFKNSPANTARFSFASTGSGLVLKVIYKVSGVADLKKDFKGTFSYIYKGQYQTAEVKPEEVMVEEVK
jgi:hypothetical protein